MINVITGPISNKLTLTVWTEYMTNHKEIRKSFKKYDLVIDKGKIITAVSVLVLLILFILFMLYLGDVFK
jgi:hypothetical protein